MVTIRQAATVFESRPSQRGHADAGGYGYAGETAAARWHRGVAVGAEASENVGIRLGAATNLLHSYGIDGYRWLIDDLPVKTW